jgi:hypothetical protein
MICFDACEFLVYTMTWTNNSVKWKEGQNLHYIDLLLHSQAKWTQLVSHMQVSRRYISTEADGTKKEINYRSGFGNHLDMCYLRVNSVGNLHS